MSISKANDTFVTSKIQQALESILPILLKIGDPRNKRGRKFPFDYMMTLLIISFLSNRRDSKNTSAYISRHVTELAEIVPEINEYGVPSQDCFNDLLSKFDTEEIEELLAEYGSSVDSNKNSLQLENVRKIIRHQVAPTAYLSECTQDFVNEERQIELYWHLPITSKTIVSIVDEKRNEDISENTTLFSRDAKTMVENNHTVNVRGTSGVNLVRDIIRESDLTGTILSLDAQHSHRTTIDILANSGGEGCYRIKKGTYRSLCATIDKEIFDNPETAKRVEHGIFTETSGSKIMTYELYTLDDTEGMCVTFSDKISQVAFLKTTVTKLLYDANRIIEKEEVTEDECYFLITCVLPLDALYQIIKQHWGIEAMDDSKTDDSLDKKRKLGKMSDKIYNREALRRISLNILQDLERSEEKMI